MAADGRLGKGGANISGRGVSFSSGFFSEHDLFLRTSTVGNWAVRLDSRHEAIISANRIRLEGSRILDIASHDGRWTFAALKAGAASVTGVEVRKDLVELAAANLLAYGVNPSASRFVLGDVFEQRDVFEEPFDVVLCLGFFYHTSRHMELVELIQRTGAHTVIIDTMLADHPEAGVTLRSEAIDNPANGLEARGVRSGKILVGHPSDTAVRVLFNHFGYSVTRYDWARLIREGGVPVDISRPHSAENPIADYAKGQRGTFVATADKPAA